MPYSCRGHEMMGATAHLATQAGKIKKSNDTVFMHTMQNKKSC
jgi:F420-dependent methylenetetrahydromethanopterin dehydrogenase